MVGTRRGPQSSLETPRTLMGREGREGKVSMRKEEPGSRTCWAKRMTFEDLPGTPDPLTPLSRQEIRPRRLKRPMKEDLNPWKTRQSLFKPKVSPSCSSAPITNPTKAYPILPRPISVPLVCDRGLRYPISHCWKSPTGRTQEKSLTHTGHLTPTRTTGPRVGEWCTQGHTAISKLESTH